MQGYSRMRWISVAEKQADLVLPDILAVVLQERICEKRTEYGTR
jgi:hypothetical protein